MSTPGRSCAATAFAYSRSGWLPTIVTVTTQPTLSAAPGWYPDPHVPAQLRWYDGTVWTVHVAHAGYAPAAPDPALKWLVPVNRSGLAIAAGYVGLASILLVFAPLAILLGVLALADLRTKPGVGGRGRAWFAIVSGTLGTLGLLAALT
jgi:Protein of unknown function (DUF2510)